MSRSLTTPHAHEVPVSDPVPPVPPPPAPVPDPDNPASPAIPVREPPSQQPPMRLNDM